MGDDPDEFADAKHGDCPARPGLAEPDDALMGGPVLGQLRAVSVDEDIGVNGYQSRPSIFS